MLFINPNSWVDSSIFLIWLKVIQPNESPQKPKNTLLVFDRCSSHYSEDIKNLFILNDSSYSLIPPGLTRYVQSLDVQINKPFKSEIHNKYYQFQIKTLNCQKPTHNDITEFVHEAWNNSEIIAKEIIIKYFKICGISNTMDSSEAHFFEFPKEILPDILHDLYEESNKDDESSNQSSESYNTEDEINN